MIAVLHENCAHVVKWVTPRDFVIELNGESVDIDRSNAKGFMRDHPDFLPGFIQIEDESAVEWDTDEDNDFRDGFYHFRYDAKVTPNRTLTRPFIVFEWVGQDNVALMEAVPLEALGVGGDRAVAPFQF